MKARGTRLSDFDTDTDSDDDDEDSWELTPPRRRRRRLQREEPVWPSSGKSVDDEDGKGSSSRLQDMLLRELREAWGRNQRGDGVVVDEHEVRVWREVMRRRWGEGVAEGRMGVRRPEALRGRGSLLRFCEGVGGLEGDGGEVEKKKGDGFGGEVDGDVRDGRGRGLGQMNGAGEKREKLWRKRIWKGFKGLVGKRS